jgi:RISC-loading complex subunit TARBP2
LGFFQTTSLNDASFDFVQFLQVIAFEQQFNVTYVDIEGRSVTGIYAGMTSWGVLV